MELFLEIHGNARLRERSAEYLAARGRLLADVTLGSAPSGVCSEAHERLTALFDLSQLRFKERDALADVFSSYASRVPLDLPAARDERMRALYGCVSPARSHTAALLVTACRACCVGSDRYDARCNVFDYDYHMRLAPAGASVVHPAHWKSWRETGLAFEFRDAAYPTPNLSLASTARGVAVASRDRNGAEQGRQARQHSWPPLTPFAVR